MALAAPTERKAVSKTSPTRPTRPMFTGKADAVTALTFYLVLLLAIPSALRQPALGGVGYPAALFAMLLGLWWCWATIRRSRRSSVATPTRTAVFCFFAAVLVGYVMAMHRALPAVEMRQADIGMLRTVVLAAIVLVCADGVGSWGRFVVLCRRVALGGGLLALLGLMQFFTKRSLIDWISIPGFSAAQAYGVIERGDFTRASATATHPLEYAAALAVFFPIALTVGIYDSERRPILRWGPPIVIAAAMILSGSRSGYLGLLVGLVVLAPSWSKRILGAVGIAAAAMVILVFVTIPGMVGTIRGLFLNTSNDPSAISRSSSYGLVEEFFLRSPLYGRGLGTFLPTYRILDNGILLLLVETGLLGLGAFLIMAGLAAGAAMTRRRQMHRGLQRQLGQAVAAAVIAGVCLTYFFDGLGFPISAGSLSLALGLCGAYARLAARSGVARAHGLSDHIPVDGLHTDQGPRYPESRS